MTLKCALRSCFLLIATGLPTLTQVSWTAAAANEQTSYLERKPQDEVVYFVLPDRFENGTIANDKGGYDGGKYDHGFDPYDKGFYQGGDLKGLTSKLPYIQELGATAIWLGPIYKNKPVQGLPDNPSAGYHGYWITDFTVPDTHFGSPQDLKEFVDTAHSMDIKIYLDIITNHTADIIQYRECHDKNYTGNYASKDSCAYRSKADYPFTTRGDAYGREINKGFLGDSPPHQTLENFQKLQRYDYAYTPFTPEDEAEIKIPAWLNELGLYHNRGETTWTNESSRHGDFAGLDDLMTEHPVVIEGFIEIFKNWITEYKIDGFRIDTAKHVNPEFWQAFLPPIIAHAKSEGIPNFYVFGEVYDSTPGGLARFTRVDEFPYVLDFAFQSAVYDVLAKSEPTLRFESLFRADELYKGGVGTATGLPVFLGNHDMGRFAYFISRENPEMSEREVQDRLTLAHAMMFFARGVPVIYYGDEQGFTGDGGDKDARETMFPSQVESYNDNNLIGTDATTADDNFNQSHPIYKSIQTMATIYQQHPTLRNGKQKVRLMEDQGGLFAFSRVDETMKSEYLVVLNMRDTAREVQVEVEPTSKVWHAVKGKCQKRVSATSSYKVIVRPYEYVICKKKGDF